MKRVCALFILVATLRTFDGCVQANVNGFCRLVIIFLCYQYMGAE